MLKAVRFDEDKHKDLLNFVDEYIDSKGRKNESEAIRFLMQKGLEALYNPQTLTQSPPSTFETKEVVNEVNMENLKKELVNEILGQINVQTFNNLSTLLDKLGNIQPVYAPPQQFTKVNDAEQEERINKVPKQKPLEIPTDNNPLLANILANANR